MELPRHFSGTNLESFQGSIWFRRTFVIPQGYLLEDALLRVGTLVDADTVYINGTEVGHVDYMYPPRRYPLPSGVLRYGENTIAVCLVSHRETGAFTEGKKYCIQGTEAIFEGGYRVESGDLMDPKPEDGKWEIDLSGQWKYKTAAVMSPLPEQTFFQYKPTAIYNGMMHPLLRYKIKGALWYQGESNESNALEYMELLTHLVKCWRTWFGENLPFICVQLPQFYDPTMGLRKNAWAELREQQRQILLLPNTGLAVTIDVGEGNDLHPQTKEAVGKRLALIARAIIYGHNIEYSGPNLVYVEYNSKDGELMLRFEHCDPPCRCKVRDDSSSAVAQFVLVIL